MNRLLALCFVFCATSIYGQQRVPSVLPCSDGFVKIHNFCYYFSVQPETFDGAEFKCRERKSNLAVINNRRQDRELKSYLTKQYAASVPRWLGGQYNWIKKQWVWRLNGKLMRYQSFYKNQSAFSEWNCLLAHPSYDYNWIGSKCWEKQYYICQTNLLHPQLKNATERSQPGYYIVTAVPPKKNKPNKNHITCPKDFDPVGKKCYHFSKDKDTWQKSYHKCEDRNSQLAIFRKPGQDKRLKVFARNTRVFNNLWVGGRYDWNGKSWKWAKNGRKIQQSQTPEKEEVWACLTWNSNSEKFGSENCLTTQYYLCQLNPVEGPRKRGKKWKVQLSFQLHNGTNPSKN